MSRETVDLARRGFQAFNDRDLDAVLAGLHDDVEAYAPRRCRGRVPRPRRGAPLVGAVAQQLS